MSCWGLFAGDLAPVGMLEEMQVEKIAVCWWRQKRALVCEARLVGQTFVPSRGNPVYELIATRDTNGTRSY